MIYRHQNDGGGQSSTRVVLILATLIGVALVATVIYETLTTEAPIPEQAWSYLMWVTIAAFGEKMVAKGAKKIGAVADAVRS